MSVFSSVNPRPKKPDERFDEIIGINSKYDNLKKMVNTMVSDANTDSLSAEYTLGRFINILIHALITETIPDSSQERQSAVGAIYALKGTPRKNIFDEIRDIPREKNILLAKKIKRALENTDKNDSNKDKNDSNKDKNDSKTTWNKYLEGLKTSYMFLDLNKDPKKEPKELYKFRVLAPPLDGVKNRGHHILLNAYDVSEFLSGIEMHIINVADKQYNITYQPGGKKNNRRKHKKKSLVNKRKTKKNSLIKKRKTKKSKKLPSKKKKN